MNSGPRTGRGREDLTPTAAEAHAVHRHMALEEHPRATKAGLTLGLYRTFAVPEIAAVLHATGRMTGRTADRAKATGALMFALIEHGPDHPEGRAALERIQRVHARAVPPSVGNEFHLYVLAAFCVTPVRWIDAHGRRPTSDRQKAAAHGFHADLAARMGITGMPPGFTEFARWMDDFEERRFRPTPYATALITATRDLLARRFPRWARPLVRAVLDATLDSRLRAGLGPREPPVAVRALVAAAVRARRRLRPIRRQHHP